MVVWLQQVLNASDLARPGHPMYEVVRRVVTVFRMIQELEESRLDPSYPDIETKLCDYLRGIMAESDSFHSDVANPEKQLRDVHECLWDCL